MRRTLAGDPVALGGQQRRRRAGGCPPPRCRRGHQRPRLGYQRSRPDRRRRRVPADSEPASAVDAALVPTLPSGRLGLIDRVRAEIGPSPARTAERITAAFWAACGDGHQDIALLLMAEGADIKPGGLGRRNAARHRPKGRGTRAGDLAAVARRTVSCRDLLNSGQRLDGAGAGSPHHADLVGVDRPRPSRSTTPSRRRARSGWAITSASRCPCGPTGCGSSTRTASRWMNSALVPAPHATSVG